MLFGGIFVCPLFFISILVGFVFCFKTMKEVAETFYGLGFLSQVLRDPDYPKLSLNAVGIVFMHIRLKP